MPLSHRRFGVDEESGKRDDDRKPSRPRRRSLQAWLLAPRFRRRRFLGVGLLFLFGLVLFAISSRLPKDGGDYGVASKTSFSFRDMLPAGSGALSTSPPAHDDSDAEEAKHYHNGPLTFPRIGVSLSRAARWRGFLEDNRNVLFVAGSLRSMTALIPLACEMARWRRSDVHFAYMGRDDVALHDVLRVNGVKAECGVNWHGVYHRSVAVRIGGNDGRLQTPVRTMRRIAPTQECGAVFMTAFSSFTNSFIRRFCSLRNRDVKTRFSWMLFSRRPSGYQLQ